MKSKRRIQLVNAYIKNDSNEVTRLPAKYNSAMLVINKVLEHAWGAKVTFIFSNKLRFDIVYDRAISNSLFRENLFSFYHDVIPNIIKGDRVFLMRNDGSCVSLPLQLESAIVVLRNHLNSALDGQYFRYDRLEAYGGFDGQGQPHKHTHQLDRLEPAFVESALTWLRSVLNLQAMEPISKIPVQNPFEF